MTNIPEMPAIVDMQTYLEDKKERDLTGEEMAYIHEHFVTEEFSGERQETLLAALDKNTEAMEKILAVVNDQEKRVCILEEDKKRRRWLVPVMIAIGSLILGAVSKLSAIATVFKKLAE